MCLGILAYISNIHQIHWVNSKMLSYALYKQKHAMCICMRILPLLSTVLLGFHVTVANWNLCYMKGTI